MAKKRRGLPKYVYEDSARGGRHRLRYRRAGFTYDFRHAIGTAGFEQEYELCRKGRRPTEVIDPDGPIAQAGTMDALIEIYYRHHRFAALSDRTKANYRSPLEAFRKEYGNTAVEDYDVLAIEDIIGAKAATPAQANKLLKILRSVFDIAVRLKWISINPARGDVKPLKMRAGGYRTWSEEDIAAFEKKHKSGTKARLAFSLLLYTGARRGDLIRLGRQNIKAGNIEFVAEKNARQVSIPIHPALAAELAHVPQGQMQFLLTEYGRPFTHAGFGNKMQQWCAEVGLSGLSAHGLRKAISRRLAESGATDEQIAAVIGDSVKTAAIYTAEADKKKLAASGMEKIGTSST